MTYCADRKGLADWVKEIAVSIRKLIFWGIFWVLVLVNILIGDRFAVDDPDEHYLGYPVDR